LGHSVNGKVVRRLHHLWDLPLRRSTRPPRPSAVRRVITEAGERANLIADLTKIGVLDLFYTDFTELAYAAGKAHLIVVVDHTSKLVPGWALDDHIGTDLALRAWSMAKRTLRRLGRSPAGCIVHHDQDSVFTSHAWLHQLLVRDRVRVSYSLDGAKQNTEREPLAVARSNDVRRAVGGRGPTNALLQPLEAALLDRAASTAGFLARDTENGKMSNVEKGIFGVGGGGPPPPPR
jgi:transposase InsO family protein